MKRHLSSLLSLPILATATVTTLGAAADISGFPVYDMHVTIAPGQTAIDLFGEILIPAIDTERTEILLGIGEVISGLEVEVSSPASVRGTELVAGEIFDGHQDGWGTRSYTLRPDVPFPADEPIRLSFRCRGEEATAFVYHLGAPTSFAGGINTAWYPQIDDTRIEEEGVSGMRATGVVTFHLPEGLEVYSAGTRMQTESGATKFSVGSPIYFSFGIGAYRIAERNGSPSVAGYFLRERENETDYVDGTAAVMSVLEATFGPYPHDRFAVVEVDTEDAGAAGFAGASLDGFMLATSGFLDRKFNTAYFGHEVGHQWWGNLMSLTGDRGGMVYSEGLAQYGSLVSVEAIDGPEAAEDYRRTGYPGYISMQSGLGYMMVAAAGHDERLPDANTGPAARILADGKGFQVWNMLGESVGPAKFSAALTDIISRRSLTAFSWEEFLADIANTLETDIDGFYEQWFERTGLPDPVLEWRNDGAGLFVTVTQSEPVYQLTMEIDLTLDTGSRETRTVEIADRVSEFEVEVSSKVTSVELDPRFKILRWTPEYRAEAEALSVPTRSRLLDWSGKTDEALEILLGAAAETTESPDPYGRQFLVETLIGRIHAKRDEYDEARSHLLAALRAPSRREDDLPWLYFFLGKAALHLEDESLLEEVRNSIRTADSLAGDVGAVAELEGAIASRNLDISNR